MTSPQPNPLPKKDVFVSYSAVDKQWADDACAAIESRGHSCWIAPRDILPGSEWGAAIIEGIDACRVMVLIFSSEANSSPQVRREIERGVGKGLIILPFRVQDVKPSGALEYALSNTHWLDGFKTPRQRQLDLLGESVHQLLAGHPSAAFPAVRQPTANSSKARVLSLVGIAAAIVIAVTLGILFASGFGKEQKKEEAKFEDKKQEDKASTEEAPEKLRQVLPRGGLWRFEIRTVGENGPEVRNGHFRIGDNVAERRIFFQKEKPASPKFEKPVGRATRDSASVQISFDGLRAMDQENGFRQITAKGKISLQTVGEWSGTLVDKEDRKWDFKCSRITD